LVFNSELVYYTVQSYKISYSNLFNIHSLSLELSKSNNVLWMNAQAWNKRQTKIRVCLKKKLCLHLSHSSTTVTLKILFSFGLALNNIKVFLYLNTMDIEILMRINKFWNNCYFLNLIDFQVNWPKPKMLKYYSLLKC
jgi:hypothetical protein